MLLHCAPMREEQVDDRALRTALHHARKTEAFAVQQSFDKAAVALVQAIPIPKEITEWVPTETFIAPTRRPWKRYAQNPTLLATGIAVLVIAIVGTFQLVERLNRFPGEPTARRLLTTASSTHAMMLDPVKTDAGALGDFLFMKHRLAHYDVPTEFADLKTLGCRVFDDEEVLHVPGGARSENGKGAGIFRLAFDRTGALGRCGERAERRLFHGRDSRKRKRSHAIHFEKERVDL